MKMWRRSPVKVGGDRFIHIPPLIHVYPCASVVYNRTVMAPGRSLRPAPCPKQAIAIVTEYGDILPSQQCNNNRVAARLFPHSMVLNDGRRFDGSIGKPISQ